MYNTEDYIKWLEQLVEDKEITDYEKTLLKDSLSHIEQGKSIDSVMYQLKNSLTPLAIKFQLSPNLLELYQHLIRYFRLPSRFSWLNFFKK